MCRQPGTFTHRQGRNPSFWCNSINTVRSAQREFNDAWGSWLGSCGSSPSEQATQMNSSTASAAQSHSHARASLFCMASLRCCCRQTPLSELQHATLGALQPPMTHHSVSAAVSGSCNIGWSTQPNPAAHAHAQSTGKQQAAVREGCAAGRWVASMLRQRHTCCRHMCVAYRQHTSSVRSQYSTSCCHTRKRQFSAWISTNSNPLAALKKHKKGRPRPRLCSELAHTQLCCEAGSTSGNVGSTVCLGAAGTSEEAI